MVLPVGRNGLDSIRLCVGRGFPPAACMSTVASTSSAVRFTETLLQATISSQPSFRPRAQNSRDPKVKSLKQSLENFTHMRQTAKLWEHSCRISYPPQHNVFK